MSTDPAIKLFGKTIALSSCTQQGGVDDYDKHTPTNKDQQSPNSEKKSETVTQTSAANDATEAEMPSSSSNTDQENQKNPTQNQKQHLKKPDKILPCPRCNSTDTKFCYYNNYNINQPRHFCKNCQRYWTAGGTMRNVPVGAGRRKTKNTPSPHLPHITIPDLAQSEKTSTVLSFGPYPWGPSYWAYSPVPWMVQGPGPVVMTSSGSTGSTVCSGSVSPLGKHCREERGNNLWAPKTLRIDDPGEATKSSFWATMGFDKGDGPGHGLFKPSGKKSMEGKCDESGQVVCLNPAALSRSINFQERS